MASTPVALTFGIEIEHILLFHETLLHPHLHTTSPTLAIKKTLSPEIRRQLCEGPPRHRLFHPEYRGWGLTTPTSYANFNLDPSIGVRTYADEVLHIEDTFFAGAGIGVDIHDNDGKKARFSKWCLMPDWSLLGLTRDELRAQLQAVDTGDIDEEIEKWDSHGVELVSPPLVPSVESFAELRRYLSVLNQSSSRPKLTVPSHTKKTIDEGAKGESSLSTKLKELSVAAIPEQAETSPIRERPATSSTGLYRAVASKECGLHVHVGLPPSIKNSSGDSAPSTFNLGHMQHLAYILVMCEPYISSLHPLHRRDPESPACQIEIRSNRQEMFQEPTYDLSEDIDLDEPQVEDEEPELDFKFVRQQIFGADVTMEVLVKRLCPGGKGHIVNLKSRTDGCPRTVEFRQAAGTLDPDDIEHWVNFCVSLVRLAHEKAQTCRTGSAAELYGGSGYPYKEWSGGMSVEDLFEMMGFDEEEKGYWRGRVERFRD